MPPPMDLVGLVRFQAAGCAGSGSPLYAGLIDSMADDVVARGPSWALLGPHEGDPPGSALVLRLMAAVHRLVLVGQAPDLARWYPSVGAVQPPAERPWPTFAALLETHRDELAEGLRQGLQTNEVGRSAALAPVLLGVAAATGRPLRLLEIGASAGLNLRFDRYRYEAGDQAWGDPAAPVRFHDVYVGAPPLGSGPPLVVAARRGCDPAPIDATSAAGRLLLRSFVWPDQLDRFRLLDAALTVAASVPVIIDTAPAGQWLPARLAEPAEGTTTVVMHSIVASYIPRPERHAMFAAIESAGAAASPDAPVAWLRMEPGPTSDRADVVLRLWRGATDDGEERLVARAGYHGRPVEWLCGGVLDGGVLGRDQLRGSR